MLVSTPVTDGITLLIVSPEAVGGKPYSPLYGKATIRKIIQHIIRLDVVPPPLRAFVRDAL